MDPVAPIFKFVYTSLFRLPALRLKTPSFIQGVPKWFIFAAMFFSYFMVMSGIIYDIINEPPSMGSVRDEKGRQRFVKKIYNSYFLVLKPLWSIVSMDNT